MPAGVDKYLQAVIKSQISIDSASRVFLGREPLEVHMVGGTRKVLLPNSKQMISLDDLVAYGAKVLGGRTPRTLALYGAEARWSDRIQARAEAGLPSNVYVANARSISYAREKNRVPPAPTYIGRRQSKMTEVFATVEEVVQAMNEGRWRTEFRRGRQSSTDRKSRGLE